MASMRKNKLVIAFLCVAFVAVSAHAAVSVPNIIGSHMVLQQGKPIPIWGKAAPGEVVTVTVDKKPVKTVADPKGSWRVNLPKMKAGGPFEMTIAGKDNTLALSDVLVGDVWLGSGQSNMQMCVKDSNDSEKEIADAKYPNIHLFSVERTVAGEPRDNCKGEWVMCSPETVIAPG